ncbi:MAG: NtrZ family periplasmic regulatory protein [Pseudomonadota bacterium]
MRAFAVALMVMFGAAALMPAAAQSIDETENRMPVETLADTEDAVPDWYQRFTFNEGREERPAWLGAGERDVQVNLLENSRWKFRLGLKSREGETGLAREEMSAGATFNITPRFSIGGALSLGAEDFTPNGEWSEQELETGIRLQSAFKF